MPDIRVGLLEKNPHRRQSLEQVIEREPGMRLAASGATLPWLLGSMATSTPDVVVLASSECQTSFAEAIVRIADWFPMVRCIVRCDNNDPQEVRLALRCGAWGALDDEADIPEVLRVIRSVADGTYYASQAITVRLLEDMCQHSVNALKSTRIGKRRSGDPSDFGAETAEELDKLRVITGLRVPDIYESLTK